MDIGELQRNWDEFGRTDPLWAILSEPGMQHGGWDLDAFLTAGEAEIDEAMAHLDALGVEVRRGVALDFGCGVGRLTQALGRSFEHAHGVDVAPAMVEEGRRINRRGEHCEYHVNGEPNLRLFDDETFDFVYSTLVLQHMEPRYISAYLREFGRILAPGGVACFQVPSTPSGEVVPPLPEAACAARLTSQRDRLVVRPGETIKLGVQVTNTSDTAWPEESALRVGNHWRSRRGRMLVIDDGRESLLQPVPAGATVDLTLIAVAPSRPGRYTLELDLVQERVAWFADRGSPVTSVRVLVVPSLVPAWRRRGAAPGAPLRPVMEIHGIAPSDVAAELARANLELVEARPSSSVQGWHDHAYVATKPG